MAHRSGDRRGRRVTRADLVAAMPASLTLPAQHTDATITIGLVIEADPTRVRAPGLAHLAPTLPPGGAELVEQYCEMWTRWLARFGREAGGGAV